MCNIQTITSLILLCYSKRNSKYSLEMQYAASIIQVITLILRTFDIRLTLDKQEYYVGEKAIMQLYVQIFLHRMI